MNEKADELGIETTLSFMHSDVFVKAPYSKDHPEAFNVFDADERQEAIEEYIGQEIDFDYYKTSGIIEQNYMLHKKDTVTLIVDSFDHYKWRLLRGMITGNYMKYFEPINMIKNYYGEKYAFEFAFLIHYASWLLIPAFFGMLVVIEMISSYLRTKSFSGAIDTSMNGVFGIFLSVWATCFLESWKRKQRNIQYYWNCGDNSFSPQDERSDDFKFYFFYNEDTDSLEKIPKKPHYWRRKGRQFLSFCMIILVVVTMTFYAQLKGLFGAKKDAHGNVTRKAGP